MSLFRFLLNLFKGHKFGYSIKGFWGQIKHFNKDGIQIGYTVKGFWGQRKRYDTHLGEEDAKDELEKMGMISAKSQRKIKAV